MSDDEVIRFEITDHDLDNEFNPNRRGRANKEQQIYGMWAKDSDEEDNEDNIRQRSRKQKDYAAPIGFVAGGVQQAGKKKAPKQEIQPAEPSSHMVIADSSDEEPAVPDESETAGIRRQGQGMRSANLGASMGNWEKHTKGIGAKLLLQMGYQPGRGLGKDLQGISAPVEATVRKGRGAIGAYGPEKAALKAKKEEERRLKEKEEEKGPEKSYHWKKSHKGRYFYRDSADVIQEGKPSMHTISSSSELSRVPVIDMTGREKRVLSGYHALRAAAPRFEHEPRRKCTDFSAPQLVHNLELMVECCEQDIIQNARELQQAEDQLVVLERDLKDCDAKIAEQDDVIDKVKDIKERVARLSQPDLSLEMAYEVVADLKESHPLEYEMFGIGSLAGNIVSPLFSALLAAWEPLAAPAEPVAVFGKWRELLSEEAYNSLLWQHYAPKLKAAAAVWNPRTPEPMLRALSAWAPVLPAWLPGALAAAAVVPRLLAAARAWDPTGDTQPLHLWVLPWHPICGSALSSSVYPLIRSRLAAALAAWHPADGSARPLLGAWREAWGAALTAVLHQHVVPKLEHCLQAAPVHLVGQENTAWLWCTDWLELLGAPALAALAARALLPRWLAALAAWLNAQPEHRAVLNSYTQFKKMFPEEVLREPGVRDAFRKALDMMNRSADLQGVEPPPPPPPPRLAPPEPKRELSLVADALANTTHHKSFSELLESRCVERGITFVPLAGKTREGRPLYRIGSDMQCYVIRNVIMFSRDNGRTFEPVGLDRLLGMAEE